MARIYKNVLNNADIEIYFFRMSKGHRYSTGIKIIKRGIGGVITGLHVEPNEIISNDDLENWSIWETVGQVSIGMTLLNAAEFAEAANDFHKCEIGEGE